MGTASDPVTDQRLALVYPNLAVRWRRVNQDMQNLHKRALRVSDGLRSIAEQWIVWGKGRALQPDGLWAVVDPLAIVTHAMPGDSMHLYGLALDTVFLGPDPYLALLPKEQREFLFSEYGRFCKAHGLVWGGDWLGKKCDPPHCQLTYGLNLQQIKQLYIIKGNASVWARCDQIMEERS